MSYLKKAFKIVGMLFFVIVLIVIMVFSFRGKYPEWTQFRRGMMKDYQEITRIYTITAGPTLIIRIDQNTAPTLDASKKMFERTREFILSEQGFQVIQEMKKGDLGTIKVTFFNPKLKGRYISFYSECYKSDCTAQDFSHWTIDNNGETWDYDPNPASD
jgi:hypothetical protein